MRKRTGWRTWPGRALRWLGRQAVRLWLSFRDHLLVGTALVLMVLLVGAMLIEMSRDTPDLKRFTALVTLILLTAAVAQFGGDLAARLKKVGPVELFSEQVADLVATLGRLDLRISAHGTPKAGDLPPEELLKYKEADRYVSQVEFSNVKLEGAQQRRFCDLLLNVALAAMRQQDWWRGRARLRYLVQLAGDSYRPGKVQYSLGYACLRCALHRKADSSVAGERREQDLWAAVDHFRNAAERIPDDHLASFYLGYSLDELDQYGGALKANAAVLELRPQFAPAKYNTAITQVKLSRFEEAFETLQRIEPTDEKQGNLLRSALEDPELAPLREHPDLGGRVVDWLKRRTERG